MIKSYNAKTTFSGYKIDLKNPNDYVGVPERLVGEDGVKVHHRGETKILKKGEHEHEMEFPDKYRPGKYYKLLYFLWKVNDESD